MSPDDQNTKLVIMRHDYLAKQGYLIMWVIAKIEIFLESF